MRDPIEDLEGFNREGLTVDSLPAAEVRRRGDRMRRRHTALATVGGIAAAAIAIAVPFAVASSTGPDREVQPAPPTTEWRQTVPEEFPLADGLATDGVVEDAGVRELEQCAPDTWALAGAVDRATAASGDGVEGFSGRTLVVYADVDAAVDALARVRSTIARCSGDPAGRLTYSAAEEDLSVEDETLVVAEQAQLEDGSLSDLTLTRLSRTGNAVLLDQAYTSAAGDDVVEQVSRDLLEDSAVPRAALCVFAVDPCDLEVLLAEDPAASSGKLTGTIPDDFPLADGLPTESSQGGAFGLTGPGRDLAPIEPTVCSQTADGMPVPRDQLRAGWTSVSETRQRMLMTFGSVAEAERWAAAVRTLLGSCPEDDLGRGATRATALVPQELGDEAFTAVSRNEQDGEPAEGLIVQQVVRVGQAVLFLQRIDEAAEGGQVPEEVAATMAEESVGVVAAMS